MKKEEDKTHTSTQKCESISSLSPEHFTFHKIGIWSSTYLLRTTLRFGNTGNQGMLFLPKTPHISLRVGRRWSNCPTIVRTIHLERLESTIGESQTTFEKKTCKNSEIGTWTGSRKYSGKGCSVSRLHKTRDEMPISPISRNQGMSQLIQSTYWLEYYVVHKVSAGYEHWCNSWSTEPLL